MAELKETKKRILERVDEIERSILTKDQIKKRLVERARRAELKKSKSFSKNLLTYYSEDEGNLMVKVTDYRNEFWAETPLGNGEVEELAIHLLKYLMASRGEDWAKRIIGVLGVKATE